MKSVQVFFIVAFVFVFCSFGFTNSSLSIADRNDFSYYQVNTGVKMEIDTRKTIEKGGKKYYFSSDGTPLTVNGEKLDLGSRFDHVMLSPSGKGNAPKKIEAEFPVAKKKGLFDYDKVAPLDDPRKGQAPVDQSAPSFVVNGERKTFDEVASATKAPEKQTITIGKDTYSAGLTYEKFASELQAQHPGKEFSSAVLYQQYEKYKDATASK